MGMGLGYRGGTFPLCSRIHSNQGRYPFSTSPCPVSTPDLNRWIRSGDVVHDYPQRFDSSLILKIKTMKKFLIITFGILSVLFVPKAYASIYVPNLTHLYHFENSINDSIGTSTLSNNNYLYYGTGMFNEGIGASGGIGYAYSNATGTHAITPGDTNFSAIVWFKSTSSAVVLAEEDATVQNFIAWSDHISIYNHLGVAELDCNGITPLDGNKHLVIERWNQSTGKLDVFYDGNNCISQTQFPGASRIANISGIGRSDYLGIPSIANGWIDDLGITNNLIETSTINSIWNSGTGKEICGTLNCDGATTSTIFEFYYPEENTSTAINPFSPWIMKIQNFPTSTTYQIKIHYTRGKECVSGLGTWQEFLQNLTTFTTPDPCGGLFNPGETYYGGVFTNTSNLFGLGNWLTFLPVERENINLNYSSADNTENNLWNANASLINYDTGAVVAYTNTSFLMNKYLITGNNGTIGTSSRNSPYTNSGGDLFFTTSTDLTSPSQFNSSTIDKCNGDLTCKIGTFFLEPHTAYKDALAEEINISKTRFPISVVFTFASTTIDALNNTSGSNPYSSMSITFPAAMGQPTTTLEIMNDHKLEDIVGKTFKDIFFDLLIKMLWLSTAIGTFIIITSP